MSVGAGEQGGSLRGKRERFLHGVAHDGGLRVQATPHRSPADARVRCRLGSVVLDEVKFLGPLGFAVPACAVVRRAAVVLHEVELFRRRRRRLFSTEIVKIVICYFFNAILLVEGVDATHAGASSGKPWRSAGRLTSRQSLVSILQN